MSEKLSSSPFMLAIEKAVIFIAFYTKKKKKKRKKVACYIRFNIYETNSAFSKQNSLEKKKISC